MQTYNATTMTAYVAPPVVSSRNKSLVNLSESLLQGVLKQSVINKSQATLMPYSDYHEAAPARVSPCNSSTDLRHRLKMALEEQQQQQEQRERDPSPRPLKKRKIDMNLNVQEDEAIRKRKALAAKLRSEGVSQRLVLKPSDFARSVFFKSQLQPIEIPLFPDPSAIDMEIHAKHSQVLYNYVRKGTDLEGFKKCVRDLQTEYNVPVTATEQNKSNHNETPSSEQRQTIFRCSNRFGESLMHLACRRGRTDMVRFLVEELPGSTPSEMLSCKDDCHKTPLHDACWTPSPNQELVELILRHAPEQAIMQDCRGNTPFDYVRREDYALWLKFLWRHKHLLGEQARKRPRQ